MFEFESLNLLHLSDLSDKPLLKNIAFYYENENAKGINLLYNVHHLPLERKLMKNFKLQDHFLNVYCLNNNYFQVSQSLFMIFIYGNQDEYSNSKYFSA